MTREEFKQRTYAVYSKPAHKTATSEQIARQTAEWEAKGNRVEPAIERESAPSRRVGVVFE